MFPSHCSDMIFSKVEDVLMVTTSPPVRRAPVQKRALATVASILDAAAATFVEHGYAGGTTNRIATVAGVSVGSLYEYFPNKDAILGALLHRRLAEVDAELDRLLASPAESAAESVDALIRALLARYGSASALDRVLLEEVPHPPEAAQALAAAEESLAERVRRHVLLRPGVQADARGPAALFTARILDTSCRAFAFHGLPGLAEGEFARELARLVGGYLGLARRAPQLGIGGAPAW